jgi:tetratricopeptide (TPR) repeat protein
MGLFDKFKSDTAPKQKTAKQWIDQGDRHGNSNNFQKASECFGEAIEIEPMNAYAWTMKGAALSNLATKRRSDALYQEAMQCYDKSLEIEPMNANAWKLKGYVHRLSGRYQEAIQCYDKALAINPRVDAMLWFYKGDAFMQLGCYQEAIKCSDKALAINPRNLSVQGLNHQARKAALKAERKNI